MENKKISYEKKSQDYHECSGNYEISNPLGIHQRPSALIISAIQEHDCKLCITKLNSKPVKIDGFLSVILLELQQGDKIKVSVRGDNGNSEACLKDLEAIFQQKFE